MEATQTKADDDSSNDDNGRNLDVWIGISLFAFVLTVWLASWTLIDHFLPLEKDASTAYTARGTFGDKFGAVNSLFSGLAFAGIIFTIFLQRRELALQRDELRETRKEFKQQNETLKKQRFETTFFQLLRLHGEIVDKLKITALGDTYTGREFFIGAIKELRYKSNSNYFRFSGLMKLSAAEIAAYKADRTVQHGFLEKLEKDEIANLAQLSNQDIDNFISEPIEDKEEKIRADYENFFHRVQFNLGHYFRNLYHIFKYVHTTDLIGKKEKQFYCNIVRAQLSTDELVLIFYNSLTPIQYYSDTPNLGFPNFKFLIDAYDVLQNMNERLLLDRRHMDIFKKNRVQEEPNTFRKQ